MPAGDLEAQIIDAIAPFRTSLRRASAGLRRDLPWLATGEPWAILVSEVMLQQTSTSRVREPWRRFIDTYPTPRACYAAPLADVLRLWSGLGYPRRAKALHDAAAVIVHAFDGEVPSTVAELLGLPGVGPYTANAVASFAFGSRVAVLDTNVGRVLSRALANRVLRPREAHCLADALLPRDGVAAFNQAMLDLGAQYCTAAPRCHECPVRATCRWRREGGEDPAPRSAGVSRPQAAYDGSDRQVRGSILRSLSGGPLDVAGLERELAPVEAPRLQALLDGLVHDGFVVLRGGFAALSGDEAASH